MTQILIVDDDEAICKTLSAILQSEGYQTTTAETAKEAIEKTKTQFFNIALLDIRLPDMEGTQLLAQLQQLSPETKKIMITGYPSLKNAVDALNCGADSYIMKPIDPAELLKTIKNKISEQKNTEKITKERIAEWIQAQTRKTQSTNFQELLEKTANELADFDLTRTQAKIYVTLTALGIASASDIAKSSKIRREEVYRIIPELEKRGIITRKVDAPRKYSAIRPEKAIEILTNAKLRKMKEEVDKLKQRQTQLVSKLKPIEMPIKHEDCSIEIIQQADATRAKLTDMVADAKQQMCIMAQLLNLELIYANRPRKLMEKIVKTVKIRIITEKCKPGMVTKQIMQFSQANNNPITIRQMKKLPFTTLIIDDKEAAWGENSPPNKTSPLFWSNNPMQINLVKTSFENLWQKASPLE